jgi:hypothetical protein
MNTTNTFTNEFIEGDASIILPDELANACLVIAKQMAPYDTGNLAEAIYSKRGINGGQNFSIVYPFREANYLYALEFGTRRTPQHVGFIRNRTVGIMVSTIEGYFNQDMMLSGMPEASGFFFKLANEKGFGSPYTKILIGKSRHVAADTQTRFERRKKSISQYNKMFYYDKKQKSIYQDSVYKQYKAYYDIEERHRQLRSKN